MKSISNIKAEIRRLVFIKKKCNKQDDTIGYKSCEIELDKERARLQSTQEIKDAVMKEIDKANLIKGEKEILKQNLNKLFDDNDN